MAINKRTRLRYKKAWKVIIVVTIVCIVLSYTGKQIKIIRYHVIYFLYHLYPVYLYVSSPISFIVVNLSNIHKNITFTSDTIYFLDGVAYDFYSIDELYNHSGPGLQWRTFPLPNESVPLNITPWMPHHRARTQTTSDHSVTTTGLAFVDHIYITTATNLTDRQANLQRMFTQYQITNYEWRMKWKTDTCNTLENKEEVYRKTNMKAKHICKINFFFRRSFFLINCKYFR
jgi:hypothetical protein